MKRHLKILSIVAIQLLACQASVAQNVILDFANRKVSADGLHWTFDLMAKGDAGYAGPNDNNWQGINLRLDLALPAGVTVVNGSGTGDPTFTTGLVGVQNSVPGSPPAGQTEVGFTLARTNQTDLNTTSFVHLATYTVNFSGSVAQGNPATPRPNAIITGSSWTNLAAPTRRPFTMATSFALPVKLISFDVKTEGNTAQINWTTSEESNSSHFDIERSQTGKAWVKIATVSAMHESKELVHYTLVDRNPLNGINLYRLHMLDLDGRDAFSRIKSVDFKVQSEISLYPNPVSKELNIKTEDFSRISKIQIYDLGGAEVYASDSTPKPLINTGYLKTGMYVVRVTENDKIVRSYKILVNN